MDWLSPGFPDASGLIDVGKLWDWVSVVVQTGKLPAGASVSRIKDLPVDGSGDGSLLLRIDKPKNAVDKFLQVVADVPLMTTQNNDEQMPIGLKNAPAKIYTPLSEHSSEIRNPKTVRI
jgi:hypothetical protein